MPSSSGSGTADAELTLALRDCDADEVVEESAERMTLAERERNHQPCFLESWVVEIEAGIVKEV